MKSVNQGITGHPIITLDRATCVLSNHRYFGSIWRPTRGGEPLHTYNSPCTWRCSV